MPDPIKLLLGPILIGAFLNTFLYGICVTQFATYYQSKRRHEDSWLIRGLVAYELLVDTFHSAAAVYFIWLYMVDNFLNPAFLQASPWPLTTVPLLIALSACPIQSFLTYRVYQLSKSGYICAMLMFLTITNAALGITTSLLAFKVPVFNDGSRLIPVVDAWLSMGLANDLSITVFLVYYLQKSRTGLTKTDGVIKRLTRSAIESAAFATLFAIVVLVTFTKLPHTGLHLMASIPLGRIYTSTMLSTLNRRDSFRRDLSGTHDLGDLGFPSSNRTILTVNITEETQTQTELDSFSKNQRYADNGKR